MKRKKVIEHPRVSAKRLTSAEAARLNRKISVPGKPSIAELRCLVCLGLRLILSQGSPFAGL